MRQHRYLTLAGAGSVAATLALSVALFTSMAGNRVEAAAIFESLREVAGNAFEITFENVGAEGILVNGSVLILMDDEVENATPFANPPKGVLVDVQVAADNTAEEEVQGLDLTATVSAMPENEWAFVKITGLPKVASEELPPAVAGVVTMLTQNGLLLDLDGFLEDEGVLGDVFEHLHFDASDGHRQTGVEVKVGTSESDEVSREVKIQTNASVTTSDEDTDLDHDAIEAMGMRILTGQASAEEFTAMVTLLEQAATNVQVAETEPGLHVLTASGFDFQGDAEAEEILGAVVLQIAYRQGSGLDSVLVEHFGQHDGTIRFVHTDVSAEDDVFDRERFAKQPGVQRFDIGQFKAMFGEMDID